MKIDLKPCPFCGGRAERVDIEEGENAGGSCICCTQCMASSNVEFEFKENFISNWNRRAAPPQAPQGDVAEAVAKEREAFLAMATERKENAYRIEREAAMCGDVGALFEARCRLKAAKEMEEAMRARAEQKADRS